MLCLRRISLDAKSRLLFLSRFHSSTNDSMPKSTAISRLIHKKFLQQNGNNSPQAIFVFLQTRGFGLSPSGRKPKNEWEKYLYKHRYLKVKSEKSGKSEEKFKPNVEKAGRFHFIILVTLGFLVYLVETDSFELFPYSRPLNSNISKEDERKRRMMIEARSSDEKDKSDAKLSEVEIRIVNHRNAFLEREYREAKEKIKKLEKLKETEFEKFLKKIRLDEIRRRLTFFGPAQKGKSNDGSDAKDSEFKFGFGPNARKPKNAMEEGLYRDTRDIFASIGKSEEELEKFLKLMDVDMVNRLFAIQCLKPGVWLAVLAYIIVTAYKHTLPSWRVFLGLFTYLPAISFIAMKIRFKMSVLENAKRREKQLENFRGVGMPKP
ncbi:hypothetical protein Ddc_16373 [Ditylenchus destructor]|nr:hypothetical protein Ddc_16373 [Ditylenchus destructor]